jgi:myo-inositol-1(or 4)-monophosphatase
MDIRVALDVAVETARAAGALLNDGLLLGKTITRKSSAVDLLTEYDQAAETLIIERLRESFPDHNLISEESEQDRFQSYESPYIWYVDPLDGTNNFANGYPVFSTSIALHESGLPVLGVVYDPTRDECFSAAAGQGAYLQTGKTKRQLQVSRENELLDSLLATGFPYDRHHVQDNNLAQLAAFLKTARGIRRGGSAALDLAYVAAGRLDGYWEFKLGSWDVAAGACLVLEAGGRISKPDGSDWIIAPKTSLIASNELIHHSMIDVLSTTRIPAG